MAGRVPPAWVVKPLLATRNAIGRAHRGMVPPEVAVFERTLGIVDTKAIAVAAELGIADLLAGGPRHASELAASCEVNADALARLLRFLVGRGIFTRGRNGRFANNGASKLLQADNPDSLREWVRFYGAPWHVDGWNRLDHSVATGGSGFAAASGRSFWEYLKADPVAGECFDTAMAQVSRLQTDLIAAAYDFNHCRRVCDVGGGTGTVLAGILATHAAVHGVLFDLPEVVARAAPVLADRGVADRVDVVGGDFFASIPTGCDRYVLQAIVHDWDDDSVVRILDNIRDAMAPGGRILVLEQTVPTGNGDHLVKALDLEMLVDTGAGRERTLDEFRALFARAHLRVERVIPVSISSILELVPA